MPLTATYLQAVHHTGQPKLVDQLTIAEVRTLETEAAVEQPLAGVGRFLSADEDMAQRVAAGDTDAWDHFFDRYSPWAYRFAYTHLNGNRADAEDLCSDIMFTAARSIGTFNPERGELDKWVYGLARHRLARFCRGRRIELPLIPDLIDHSSNPHPTYTSFAEKTVMRDVVNRALAALPERQASALIAKYVEGYTTDEMAKQIEASPKAVESLLVRARNSFRSALNALLEPEQGTSGTGGGDLG